MKNQVHSFGNVDSKSLIDLLISANYVKLTLQSFEMYPFPRLTSLDTKYRELLYKVKNRIVFTNSLLTRIILRKILSMD